MIKRFFIVLLLVAGLQLSTHTFWSSQFSRNTARLNKYGVSKKLPEVMPVKKHTFDYKPEEISRSPFIIRSEAQGSLTNPSYAQPRWKNPYAVFGFGLLSTYGWYKGSSELERMKREGEQARALREETTKKILSERGTLINPSDFPYKPGSEK